MSPEPAGHAPVLPLTGERTIPDIPEENYWLSEWSTLCDSWSEQDSG